MKTVAVLNSKEGTGETTSAVNLATEHRGPSEWRKRADYLNETEDWQGMIEWCRWWKKREPKNADAWSFLGNAYAEFNRHDDDIGDDGNVNRKLTICDNRILTTPEHS